MARNLLSVAVFECVFYFAYRFGMSFPMDYPSPLWFPDSVLLCALLFSRKSSWWMFILAPLPIRLMTAVPEGTPLWFLLACFLNDSLKGLLSAFLLRRRADSGLWFDNVSAFARYVLIAVVFSPALSALAGAATRAALDEKFWTAWTQWFLGNALASLVVTPVLFCFLRDFNSVSQAKPKRHVELILLATTLILASAISFSMGSNEFAHPLYLLYLPVPFLLWAAVRLGPMGTCLILTIISALATVGAAKGIGPFSSHAARTSVLAIQLFLIVPSVSFLLLSVLRQQQRVSDSALRESERRFRSLVDTAPVMVWMSDADGIFTYFNKPWLQFTGTPAERQLGNRWGTLLHPQDEPTATEYLSAFQHQKPFTLEYRLRRHDGTYHWILDKGAPRHDPEGQFLGYIGSCIDIEDRKKGEEELLSLHKALINAQEAERQRIGQELHDDLGQRVVALLIGLSHLSEQTAGNEKLRTSFVEMSQQASEIVRDIAHLSHHLRPIMLERLGVAGALQDLCGKSKGPAGVRVVFSQHGELPEVVPWTTSIALYRVAQEALRNALAHSGSSIIQIDLTALGSDLVMTVADKGRGFTVAGQRMGLGLSGMAERMRNVNGVFSINSVPGAGTTVTASAPLVEQQRRMPLPEPSCEMAPDA